MQTSQIQDIGPISISIYPNIWMMMLIDMIYFKYDTERDMIRSIFELCNNIPWKLCNEMAIDHLSATPIQTSALTFLKILLEWML